MRTAIALLAVSIASGALADDLLGLGGVYGDERGCSDQELKDYSEEPILVLRGDGYQTYVSGCEFVEALKTKGGEQIVTGVCGNEGDGERSIEMIRVTGVEGADAYELYSAAGDLIGRVARCAS